MATQKVVDVIGETLKLSTVSADLEIRTGGVSIVGGFVCAGVARILRRTIINTMVGGEFQFANVGIIHLPITSPTWVREGI